MVRKRTARLIHLRRAIVGYVNIVPAIAAVLLPAILITSVYLAVLARVQVTFGITRNYTALTGACFADDNCPVLVPCRAR